MASSVAGRVAQLVAAVGQRQRQLVGQAAGRPRVGFEGDDLPLGQPPVSDRARSARPIRPGGGALAHCWIASRRENVDRCSVIPCRAQQLARHAHQLVLGRSLQPLAVDDRRRARPGPSPSSAIRVRSSCGDVAPIEVVVLGLARIQRRGLGGPRAGLAAVRHAPHDLLVPAALIAQHGPRHAPDLGRQLARRHRLPLAPPAAASSRPAARRDTAPTRS